MKVQIKTNDVRLTKAIRDHVELRVGFAFSRYAEKINSVTVYLTKSEEHPSKTNNCCRIEVRLRRRVRVQVTDAKLLSAINRAFERAAGTVKQTLKQDDERLQRTSAVSMPKRNKNKAAVRRKGSSKLKKKRALGPHYK